MKSYKFTGHTADIRMKIEGDTLEELFLAALLGMSDMLSPGFCSNNEGGSEVFREIAISSADVTTLIIDFLSEALTCAYEERAVFCKIDFLNINEKALRAKVYGKKIFAFYEDIKAVTYHEAEVIKNEKGNWETTIVFDI